MHASSTSGCAEGAGVAPHDPPVASPQAPAAAEADPQSSPTTPDSKRRRRSAVPSFGSQGSDSCSSGEGSGESCCDTSSSAEPCSQAGNGVHLTHKVHPILLSNTEHHQRQCVIR